MLTIFSPELRQKEENLTRTLDEKNEQLSSVKHELQLRERLLSDKERAAQIKKVGSLLLLLLF